MQADFGEQSNENTGILLEDKNRKNIVAGSRMQLRCMKDRARIPHGIALEQTTRTTLRGVFIQTALRLRMLRLLRLPNRPVPGSAASGPPADRTIRSKAVGSCLNNEFRAKSNHPFELKESVGSIGYWISCQLANDAR